MPILYRLSVHFIQTQANRAMAVMGLGLSGCVIWQPVPSAPTPVVASTPAASTAAAVAASSQRLSPQASAALDIARQRVAAAKGNRTLWKSALDKLAAAESAAARKDSRDTITLSNEIVALCELSTAQALRPPVVW
ncbi:MAG: hypothetical protein ACK53F_00615 [Betaproteobacteria bacterium]